MSAKKKPVKRRDNIERPYCNGEWSQARFTSFIKSALRGARWPEKYRAIQNAFIEHGTNPATGRKCKLHLCSICRGLFPQNAVHADHVVPVIGPEGFVSWDLFIERLYCEANGFRALCKGCHKIITDAERAERAAHSSKPPQSDELL